MFNKSWKLNFTEVKNVLLTLTVLFILPFVIPDYLEGRSRADGSDSEARKILASIAQAQITYFTLHNEWAGFGKDSKVFETLGIKPASSSQYAVYCGKNRIIPKAPRHKFDFPDQSNWPYGLYPEISASDFTCLAIANNDRDRFPDIWMVNKFAEPLHLLDDADNEILIDIVDEPFDPNLYFANKIDKSEKRELSNLYIEINIPAYRLDLYENGRKVKSYPIAIGMRGYKTPTRTFYVDRMEWNPWWLPPNANWCKPKDEEGNPTGPCKPVGPGPGNPLGPVKMIMQSSFLIHGTSKPYSIGKRASHGCIRMHSKNALDLGWKVMVLSGAKQNLTSWDRYNDKSRRTYKIALLRPVQVNTIYERLEVHENTLILHPDTYKWQPLTSEERKARIEKFGFSWESFSEESRKKLLQSTISKPVVIPITP